MSKKNAFAQYVADHNIDTESIARQLKVTRAYCNLLIRGATTPSLRLASDIEHWSKGTITMQMWIVRRGRPPGKKNTPKKPEKITVVANPIAETSKEPKKNGKAKTEKIIEMLEQEEILEDELLDIE